MNCKKKTKAMKEKYSLLKGCIIKTPSPLCGSAKAFQVRVYTQRVTGWGTVSSGEQIARTSVLKAGKTSKEMGH